MKVSRLVVVCGFVTLLIAVFAYYKSSSPTAYSSPGRVLVTSAHTELIDGYDCVYSDSTQDIAVYVCKDYVATSLDPSDRVFTAGTRAFVKSVTPTEFTVTVADISKIIPGVSGSPVYYKGAVVGFISGWNGDGTVRCIFY